MSLGATALALVVASFSLAQPPRGQRGKQEPGQEQSPTPQVQPRGLQPHAFVITGAKVVTEPGQVLPEATIIIRDGLIEAVGADVKAPPDALKIDGKGLTVYPGFVDACGTWGFDTAMRRSEVGPPSAEDLASETLVATKSDNRKGLTPEFNVNAALKTDNEAEDTWRKVGFTSHLIAPDGGFMGGQSAVISHSGAAPREAILRAPFAMHFSLRTTGGPGAGEGYPRALMGVFAHCRQTLLDAQHYQRLHAAFEKSGGVGKRPPFDPSLEALLPVLDGKMPVIMEADGRDNIHRSLDFAAEFKLKPIITGGREAWKVADRLKKENVPVILRLGFAEANEEREKDLPKRALDERRRIRAEEVQTAKKLLDAGVVVVFGTAGLGDRASEKFQSNVRKMIAAGLSPEAALAALTTMPAKLFGLDGQLGRIAVGRPAHLFVTNGDFHAERTQAKFAFADGVRFEFDAPATEEAQAPRGGRGPGGPGGPGGGGRFAGGRGRGDRNSDEKMPAPFVGPPTVEDENTEIEADRKPTLKTGGNVLIKNATVFTVSNGTKLNCDVLVKNGKIAAIGTNLAAEPGMKVIDAAGLSVMPGIIDTHSHFASSGGLNEFSLSVVPEVRVRDVVEGDDVQIYRALAGGVTTARILHGSANCVGGQDAVLKMKYGLPGRELIVNDGPRGVKFALGENVKRTDGRFPNSRLGVEAVLIRAFSEARDYSKMWEQYEQAKKSGKTVTEPRRDLRLEALADILKGDLKVHCHCYRADEILMLLRVADKFGFKVKSLQHVLEGYKIAPEIAAHGASVSLFSDWWAYKIEAFDAIPFAAALLRSAGAMVCLKSDSNELMRHMYQEATKLIKYGGLSEADAFASITINAAKQLGIDQRTGSLDVGKDADIAIFNGHPLNSFSRVELTLVEGEVYFQRSPQATSEAIAAAPPVAPRDNTFKLPERVTGPIAIRGATIHPVSGPPIPNGTVVIDQGRIRAVGTNGSAVIPPNATIIPGEGLHLYPGMIDAGTVLGLAEIESSRETNDFREGGDFQPDLRASIAINPDSELIPVTRANGVTTVVTRPSGSMVAGQSVLLNLSGWTPREMTVVDGLALNVDFPASVNVGFGRGGDPGAEGAFGARGLQRRQRDEKVKRLRELFAQAIAYDEGRKLSPSTPANPRLEAVVPYARGEKPVVMQVSRKADILEVLKLADELKLKIILSGATDAWRVADEIKKRDIPVIVGPIMAMPTEREDPFDAPFTAPAKLHAAGIRYCIRTGTSGGANSGSSNTRNLPYEAAFAVSYGLPEDEGLKSITLYPAQILGVEKELGSIDVGKRANLVLSTGNPMQASSQVQAIFIDGKPLEPTSKQTRLYDRYKERLREVQEGRVPLGTK